MSFFFCFFFGVCAPCFFVCDFSSLVYVWLLFFAFGSVWFLILVVVLFLTMVNETKVNIHCMSRQQIGSPGADSPESETPGDLQPSMTNKFLAIEGSKKSSRTSEKSATPKNHAKMTHMRHLRVPQRAPREIRRLLRLPLHKRVEQKKKRHLPEPLLPRSIKKKPVTPRVAPRNLRLQVIHAAVCAMRTARTPQLRFVPHQQHHPIVRTAISATINGVSGPLPVVGQQLLPVRTMRRVNPHPDVVTVNPQVPLRGWWARLLEGTLTTMISSSKRC